MGQKTTLVGESFAPWVKDQVEARQNLLGRRAGERYTNNELRYMNSKTSFLRLVSGVNINENFSPSNTTRLEDLGLSDDFLNEKLARHFVLEGGTTIISQSASNPSGNPQFRSGLAKSLNATDTSLNSMGVYGLASSEEYGYSPMPGLIDAEIKSLNRGSLKEATVKIKCWNPRQFDIIDTLFIKLKYGMLLEWGHSIYVDNNGEVQNNNFSLAEEFLSAQPTAGVEATNSDQQAIYRSIEKYREESNGNYDAILAYVKNFNWTLNPDNSYDIELSLISIGDVIESLKVDVTLKNNYNIEIAGYDEEDQKEAESTLIKHANRSLLDKIFGGIYQTTEFIDDVTAGSKKLGTVVKRGTGEAQQIKIDTISDIINDSKNKFFTSFPKALKDGLSTLLPQLHLDTSLSKSQQKAIVKAFERIASPEVVRLEFADISDGQEEAYYVKLGTLLRIIENAFIPKSDPTSENPEPMFRINNTFRTVIEEGNDLERVALCYTLPVQVSQDPSVCLIPLPEDLDDIQSLLEVDVLQKLRNANPELSEADAREYLKENVDADEPWWSFGAGSDTQQFIDNFKEATDEAKKFNKFLGKHFRRTDSDYIGNMNHIHVNLGFVSKIFTKLINAQEKNKGVNVYEFLNQIMSGIGTALGGLNDFEVVYDSDINFFYIIDNTQLPDGPKVAKEINEDPVEFLINIQDPIGGRGSFVTNTQIKSEISSELASEISIAAVSPGQSSQNATSTRFQWLNYGTENRILRATEVADQQGDSENNAVSEEELESILENYAFTLENFAFYLKQVANQYYNESDAQDQVTALKNIFTLASQEIEKSQVSDPEKEGTQARGFIPINLSITLDGLSGPKIYEKFKIPDTFLPSSYKGNVNFLVKEITHTIGEGKWETSFGSLCVPFTSKEGVTTHAKLPETKTSNPNQSSNSTAPEEPDDYKSLSSGLPHGRPPYEVPGYQFAKGGSKTNAGDGYRIFQKQKRRKTQIILHHTAGHAKQGAEGTAVTAQVIWSKRADHVSTHAVISFDGYVDLLFPDEFYGNNTGKGYNNRTLGIEIQSLGYCYQKGNKVISAASTGELPAFDGNNKGYIAAVDKFGNDNPYKDYQYYQAYTQAQIDATIAQTLNWINKHNIPFSYDYDLLFPKKTGTTYDNSYNTWKAGTPGVYTHNSLKPTKSDIFPQYDMLFALRNLALQLKQEGRPDCLGDVTDYGPNFPNGYNL
jgi:hypothetical protein